MVDVSEEYLFWASKQYDDPDPGTTFQCVQTALANHGQPLEEEWPYDDARGDADATYTPPSAAHSSQPRWHPSFTPVPATPASITTELDAGRVVVLGMPTWDAFDFPAASTLTVPRTQDLDGAYHAVAVVGYDAATGEMLIRNSWGDTWGDAGCVWLPLRFADEFICEAWVVGAATPTSPPPKATSRRYSAR